MNYAFLMAQFVLPWVVAIKTCVVPALFKYFEHCIGYVRLPFP